MPSGAAPSRWPIGSVKWCRILIGRARSVNRCGHARSTASVGTMPPAACWACTKRSAPRVPNCAPPPWRNSSKVIMRTSLVELWQYRELMYNLTVRDLKVRYKNSVLGIAWSLLNPILMMLVFTLVYTVMLGQSNRRDYAAFILCGLLPWNFFSGSIMGGTGSIVNNGYLIKKVYFPRLVLPTSIMLSNLVNFLVALPVYFILSWLLGVRFTLYVLFLPIVIFVEMCSK